MIDETEGRMFLSEREAARILRVHPATLGRLVKAGNPPVEPVLIGTRRVYSAVAVRELAGLKA
ncbi:hypothetical protein [Microbacterium sp.]|uniref:hypothetical protein n=1 Tax=Microbacterium sp. TaxID=51671 RepID=UPI0039E54BC5